MNAQALSAALDRIMASYTMMGLTVDQEKRQMLRETVAVHVRGHVDKGQHDIDRLVVLGLKHLVSLEDNRIPLRRRG